MIIACEIFESEIIMTERIEDRLKDILYRSTKYRRRVNSVSMFEINSEIIVVKHYIKDTYYFILCRRRIKVGYQGRC